MIRHGQAPKDKARKCPKNVYIVMFGTQSSGDRNWLWLRNWTGQIPNAIFGVPKLPKLTKSEADLIRGSGITG